jgi:hypothetical protein
MHCTEQYKLLKDELSYYVNSRNLLRDELLNVYRFLDDLDMFEAYLDNRNFTSTTKNDKSVASIGGLQNLSYEEKRKVKNCVESNKNGKVAVLFSGGNDCSLVALKYLKRNYCVDLLHFCHGVNISNNLHRIRYQELEKVAPERIQLVEISHKGMFRKFSLQDIEVDFAEHKTSMICLGCRLAMHVEAIMYCKKNGGFISLCGLSSSLGYTPYPCSA